MKVTKIMVLHHAFGRDDVLLRIDGMVDPVDPSQPLDLGVKVPKREGVGWAQRVFPGVDIEVVNAFGDVKPLPFSSLERQQAAARVEDLRANLIREGAEPGIHDSVIVNPISVTELRRNAETRPDDPMEQVDPVPFNVGDVVRWKHGVQSMRMRVLGWSTPAKLLIEVVDAGTNANAVVGKWMIVLDTEVVKA